MERRLIRIGVTHGDTNGVGYEVILKTFADERMAELCTPVIYGSLKIAQYYQRKMNLPAVNFEIINRAEGATDGKVNLINCVDEDIKVLPGQAMPEAGAAAYKALEA
ncbi:MAG: 4-hydroxythreonine-4-phosphate dehydrogenase PdxA, partial [Tannerella sp.]|nr:4-hydroxythreonine-4-phosphate dehydrogenase PdxA [Tannerella sp.]